VKKSASSNESKYQSSLELLESDFNKLNEDYSKLNQSEVDIENENDQIKFTNKQLNDKLVSSQQIYNEVSNDLNKEKNIEKNSYLDLNTQKKTYNKLNQDNMDLENKV
jgi:hypothetical protein